VCLSKPLAAPSIFEFHSDFALAAGCHAAEAMDLISVVLESHFIFSIKASFNFFL
jgi:hypothetical protein